MKPVYRLLAVTLFILPCINIKAQKFEAENATLSGGAIVQSNAVLSNGKFVAQNAGNLTWSITLPLEGYFDIFINAAAPNGNKINIFAVDNNSINFNSNIAEYTTAKVVSGLKLLNGAHTLKIEKSWGYINIDYIELKAISPSSRFDTNTALVTFNATDEASRLYQFIYDNYGSKIISGVMTLSSMDEVTWLKTNTGKEPALVGLDFMHSGRNYNWYNDEEPINDARTFYDKNGIPAFCWHWRDPLRTTEEFYTSGTTFDISKVFDESSPEYIAMINDIDYISSLLKKLQDEGVPVIWRPLHEAAGGWFWWGAKGANPCKKLWQVMYDRMVNQNGIRNLIWVWTREPNDDEWYPGDSYVDIVSRDIYKDGDHNSQILEFSDLNERYGKKKIVTLSECGSFPDPDNLSRDGAGWSWFMPWYGSFVKESKYNPLSLWTKTMAHDYVITLDEMPNLRTYEAVPKEPEPEPDPVLAATQNTGELVSIYPTITESSINIESSKPIGTMRIMDNLGRTVFKDDVSKITKTINISNLPPGLYYVKLKSGKAVRVLKK